MIFLQPNFGSRFFGGGWVSEPKDPPLCYKQSLPYTALSRLHHIAFCRSTPPQEPVALEVSLVCSTKATILSKSFPSEDSAAPAAPGDAEAAARAAKSPSPTRAAKSPSRSRDSASGSAPAEPCVQAVALQALDVSFGPQAASGLKSPSQGGVARVAKDAPSPLINRCRGAWQHPPRAAPRNAVVGPDQVVNHMNTVECVGGRGGCHQG